MRVITNKMEKKIFKALNYFVAILFVGFLTIPFFVVRADPILPSDGGCTIGGTHYDNCGNYKLDDFVQIGLNVSKWILGISGSAALLIFIYGGVMFLISAGNSERVKKGQQILVGAVIGIVIVFAAYTIIGFIIHAMGVPQSTQNQWASSGWFK